MKKFTIIALVSILLVVFVIPISASAATNPGIKPGSFFYFFDITFEKIGLFFTFSPEKKVRKALEYANERLAEAEAVAKNNDADATKTAITKYESNIAFAAEKSKDVLEKGKAQVLLASIADNISKNQKILADLLNKAPDGAEEVVTKAIEVSKKEQEEITKQIAELKGEVGQLKKEVEVLKVVPSPKNAVPSSGISCNGKYWTSCPTGQKFYCPLSGDATCVIENTGISQQNLNLTTNIKVQTISLLTRIISDLRTLDSEQTSEIARISGILNSLVNGNDSASDLLRKLSILRRDRLVTGQGALRLYISNVEDIQQKMEAKEATSFLSFSPENTFADSVNFIDKTKVAFQKDTANYDDNIRKYLSILDSENSQGSFSQQPVSDPSIEAALSQLRATLDSIANKPIAMESIRGQQERAVQDWLRQNPNTFSSSFHIGQFNALILSYGLYYMVIPQ